MLSTENLLLNLKIISSIKENTKLKRNKDGNLSIEENWMMSGFVRFINRDNRIRCLEDIKRVIDFSIEKTKDIINSKYFSKNLIKCNIQDSFIFEKMSEEDSEKQNELHCLNYDMKKSIDGLLILKETYKDDSTTISKIMILISKINSHCEFIENKYLKK